MEALKPSKNQIQFFLVALFTGILIALTACGPLPIDNSASIPPAGTCPECEELICPEPVRYEDLWAISKHADAEAEAFIHWNEDEPQEIPVACAKCHSRPGFIDFLGVDGTPPNQVDNPAITGTTISCFVCHNEATDDLDSVDFPSGVKVRLLGDEARCIQCHQGRASTGSVDNAISELNLEELDTPSTELSFINSHSTSAATLFGSEVQGAYQYAGKEYIGRFYRADEFFSCIKCHDQHSLELKVDMCGDCHTTDSEDTKDIRVDTTDFDGDGNTTEGVAFEISTIHEALYGAIKNYASQVTGVPIAYDINTHPYYFIDTNGNGAIDNQENSEENVYNAWTPRLLRAAYNYNYVTHDLGAYAHNSDYVLQVIYDSLADLGSDMTSMKRP